MFSGGFLIVVTNSSLNDSKSHSLEPTSNNFKDLDSTEIGNPVSDTRLPCKFRCACTKMFSKATKIFGPETHYSV